MNRLISLRNLSLLAAATLAAQSVSAAPVGDDQQDVNIVGGTNVRSTDPIAKSTVLLVGAIVEAGNPQPQEYICTGTLIAPDLVITAAHCVAENVAAPTNAANLLVIFNTKIPTTGTDPSIHKIVGYKFNPGWAGVGADGSVNGEDLHDIALIRFSGALPAGYVPAKVIPSNLHLTVGQTVTLAGYGINSASDQTGASAGTLRKVNVKIDAFSSGATETEVDESHHKGSCSGDSGGPAFATFNGSTYVWGATSRGDQNCAIAGIYTNIASYAPFIATSTTALRAMH